MDIRESGINSASTFENGRCTAIDLGHGSNFGTRNWRTDEFDDAIIEDAKDIVDSVILETQNINSTDPEQLDVGRPYKRSTAILNVAENANRTFKMMARGTFFSRP